MPWTGRSYGAELLVISQPEPALLSHVEGLDLNFIAPGKIAIGWGRREELGNLCRPLGHTAWVVWGSRRLKNGQLGSDLIDSLVRAGVEPTDLITISREPLISDVDSAAQDVRQSANAGDLIIGIGGGSAIDLAKAVAAMATSEPDTSVKDYLEGVGRNLQLTHRPLPVVAVPTTAGTGSEATKNAVIGSDQPPFKKSLRSPWMVPRVVLVDPQLTVGLTAEQTAHTGMDAITQLVESYISRRSNSLTRSLVLNGLRLAVPNLEEAVRDGSSRSAREAMSEAALLSGMALANSGLGMAHGVAAALGAHHGVAHGLACAVMVPVALRVNLDTCQELYAEMARALDLVSLGDPAERAANALVTRIDELCAAIGIPSRLTALGVSRADLPLLVQGSRGNSMAGNPRSISDDELLQILERQL